MAFLGVALLFRAVSVMAYPITITSLMVELAVLVLGALFLRQLPKQWPAHSKAVAAQHPGRERKAAEASLVADKKDEEDGDTAAEWRDVFDAENENADRLARKSSCSYNSSNTSMLHLGLDEMVKAAHPTTRYVRDPVGGDGGATRTESMLSVASSSCSVLQAAPWLTSVDSFNPPEASERAASDLSSLSEFMRDDSLCMHEQWLRSFKGVLAVNEPVHLNPPSNRRWTFDNTASLLQETGPKEQQPENKTELNHQIDAWGKVMYGKEGIPTRRRQTIAGPPSIHVQHCDHLPQPVQNFAWPLGKNKCNAKSGTRSFISCSTTTPRNAAPWLTFNDNSVRATLETELAPLGEFSLEQLRPLLQLAQVPEMEITRQVPEDKTDIALTEMSNQDIALIARSRNSSVLSNLGITDLQTLRHLAAER